MSLLLNLIVISMSLSLLALVIYLNREKIYNSIGVVNPSVLDILKARSIDNDIPNILLIVMWFALTLLLCTPVLDIVIFGVIFCLIFGGVIFCITFGTGYLIKLMLSNQVKTKKLEGL